MELYVNLDEDGAQFLIDGENVHFWNWTNGGMNQFAAFDFYGWTLSSGSCEYYFDDLMIEETEWTMPVLAAPSNLEAEVLGTDVHLTWEVPTSDLLMLSQHDNSPYSGYYQEYGWGYGVVYDLSAYSASTVEKIDFRHTSYGIMGTWDYKVHIVDWDTYTEIAEAGPFQTTVNDDWEFDVDLGSVASSGGLVGIFIEPMGNDPADAYPVVDWDVALDGSSVYGILSDYSNFVAAGGDFLINLWIMGASDGKYVQAPIVKVNGTGQAASRNAVNPFVGDELEVKQMVTGMSELLGYNVYRDDVIIANTNEEMYDDLGLPAGQYAYHVTAVYDLGESGPSNTVLVDIITGVEQAVSDEFRIYPNPVSDYIFLESMQPIKRVVMYNANGQVVVNELVSDQETHKIDAGDLNTGIYNIRIETENGWINKKVIKK
jgi:hypothetical protein